MITQYPTVGVWKCENIYFVEIYSVYLNNNNNPILLVIISKKSKVVATTLFVDFFILFLRYIDTSLKISVIIATEKIAIDVMANINPSSYWLLNHENKLYPLVNEVVTPLNTINRNKYPTILIIPNKTKLRL